MDSYSLIGRNDKSRRAWANMFFIRLRTFNVTPSSAKRLLTALVVYRVDPGVPGVRDPVRSSRFSHVTSPPSGS